jgi:DNA-directed RNA polymerase specialized sigma24 family protein
MEPSMVVRGDDERLAFVDRLGTALGADDLLIVLPAGQRDAIRARILEERDYPEIAAELRCSEAAARKRVSRGLAALRRRIGERPT